MDSPLPTTADPAFEPIAHGAIDQSIGARFSSMASKFSDRVAIETDDRAVSYKELDARTRAVSGSLMACGVQPGDRVVLLLPQGVPSVVVTLAVLRAGAIYVPLDNTANVEHVQTVVRHCSPRVIIAAGEELEMARHACGEQACTMDVVELMRPGSTQSRTDAAIDADAPAYIYYTSGTTGAPKGVVDCHRNVLHNILRYTNSLHIGPADRLSVIQRPSFSGVVSSTFCALLNGASLHPFDVQANGLNALGPWINRRRITIYHSVPSIFRHVSRDNASFPSVRIVRLEGDRASVGDVALFKKHFGPHGVLVNGLGATECGLVRQFFVRHGDVVTGDGLPIGYATQDMETRILAADGAPANPGETGEIAIVSKYVATGYWNDAQRTAAAFSPLSDGRRQYRTGDLGRLRADGCLEHIGRASDRLRVHGEWVDPTSIEAAIAATGLVREVVVGVRSKRGDDSDGRLAAFVVPHDPALTVTALRRAITSVAATGSSSIEFNFVDAIPLSLSGKVDRRALAALPRARPAMEAPHAAARDALEAQVISAWEQSLDITGIGTNDDYFDLGGDSLTAADLVLRLEQALGVPIDVGMLAASPTPAGMANAIRTRPISAPVDPFVHHRPDATAGTLIYFHGDYSSRGLYCSQIARYLPPAWGMLAIAPHGLDGGPVPPTIQEMAAERIARIRRTLPQGPYTLAGHCNIGGLVALETAIQLREAGQHVAMVGLIDSTVPNATGMARFSQRALDVVLPRRISGRIAGQLREHWAALRTPNASPEQAGHLREAAAEPIDVKLWRRFGWIVDGHMPGWFEGTIDLLWPLDDPIIPADRAVETWSRHARHVVIHNFKGDHLTCLTRYAENLARALHECIEQGIRATSPESRR